MNCATNSQEQYQPQQQQQEKLSVTENEIIGGPDTSSVTTRTTIGEQVASKDLLQENSTLMIKNIVETSSSRTDWDEKEEETENINLLSSRRESVPEDISAVQTITIHENFENSNTQNLSSLPSLKTSRIDTQSTSTAEAAVDDATNVVNNSNEIVIVEAETSQNIVQQEQQQTEQEREQQQEQQEQTLTNNSNKESFTSGSTTIIHSADNNDSVKTIKLNRPSSPTIGQRCNSSTNLKGAIQRIPSYAKLIPNEVQSGGHNVITISKVDEDSISKSSDTSGELLRGILSPDNSSEKSKNSTNRLSSERTKRKSWFNVLCPNYKSRCQDFKKLFKEVPTDERLIVDYSCALQRDILVQGRLYVSQNYVCFHANIFRWETYLTIKWRDVTSITKEKTALVIPNAISICTAKEKYFFATFAARDKSFLMLFRVWQNTLMNKQMLPQEMWQWVHNCYGDELGLTTDDEDYIDPSIVTKEIEAEAAEVDDSDLDFVSATDDASSLLDRELEAEAAALIEETIASNFNCKETDDYDYKKPNLMKISENGIVSLCNSTIYLDSSNIASIAKSIRKTHSSSSTTTTTTTSTATTTTSGSDNKISDNNSSSTDNKSNQKHNNSTFKSSNNNSKSHIKLSTKETATMSTKLSSADEGGGSARSINGTSGGRGGGSGGGSGGSATGNENKSTSVMHDGKKKLAKNIRQRDESLAKNAGETLPTDVSDSSDSDENKIPFIATAECNSLHEGRQLVHTILPINIDTLFNLLFSKSKFLTDFHVMRKSSDTVFGDWEISEDGQKTRTVNLTVSLSASVGPKTSRVTEHQIIRDCSKPSELYSIDINTINAGIPYADSFSVLLHYCLVRTVDDHTMLSVHAQIKYKKSIWGVVKGFIEKNTWAGLEDFYTSLLRALQSETNIPPAKGKGRRPRRGTAQSVRPLEETLPTLQIKPDNGTENVHTPDTLTPEQQITNKTMPAENTNKYKWLSLFVIVLLILLILLNVILLLKLWKLEMRIESEYNSRQRLPNLATMKELPTTPQDWIDLVRKQEILHDAELQKWHTVLQTAIELLKKVSLVCQTISQDDTLTQKIEQIKDEL